MGEIKMETMETSYLIIGGGAAGLVVATGLAKAGRDVLLVEGGSYGGDCTNYGCIPSKSLLASAHIAAALQRCHRFGIEVKDPSFTTEEVFHRISEIITRIRHEEEPEQLTKKGIKTVSGKGTFLSPQEIQVELDGKLLIIKSRTIIIATGSRPTIIDHGLIDDPRIHTNETIFSLKELPREITIVGGGPIGCEMAQSFSRLGVKVTLIHSHPDLLPEDDTMAAAIIERQLIQEGIRLLLNHSLVEIERGGDKLILHLLFEEEERKLSTSMVLLAMGRTVETKGLALERARVATGAMGEILVDRYGRTSSPHIFAIGDVIGPPFLTHRAEAHGRAVLKTLLIPFWKSPIEDEPLPHVIYTDPELAHVGLTQKEAVHRYGRAVECYHFPFDRLDRAIVSSCEEGAIFLSAKRWSGKIIGATIVGERAGEMIGEISLAMRENIPLRRIVRLIHPYPSYSMAIRLTADLWFTQTMIPALRRLVGG